ncbi:MAG: hypothetical protein M5U26_14095 [Planctomycetota bacterium]|nr:hypothetical protein [Planctomycetota bacterium]
MTRAARTSREHVEFLIVPFVDKDGVEDGDQGKNRKPYDHNRDYGENCIYPSVGAIRELVPAWAGGKLRFGIDLHCPHIRGPHNEVLYFVGGPDEAAWARCLEFCALLESACRGPLPYFAKDNLPFGQGWNTTQAGVLKSCGRWLCEQPGILWGHTIEFPYANVSGAVVSVEGARAFGRDLLAAMERYLKEVVEAAG